MTIQWDGNSINRFVNSLQNVANEIEPSAPAGRAGATKYLKIANGIVSTTADKNEACSKKQLKDIINSILKSDDLDPQSRKTIERNINLIKKSNADVKGTIAKIIVSKLSALMTDDNRRSRPTMPENPLHYLDYNDNWDSKELFEAKEQYIKDLNKYYDYMRSNYKEMRTNPFLRPSGSRLNADA